MADQAPVPARRSGQLLRRTTGALVVVVLAAAAAAYRFDAGEQLGLAQPRHGASSPSAAAPPAAAVVRLEVPAAAPAAPVAAELVARHASPAAVQSAVAAPMQDRRLGRRVSVAVAELAGGRQVFAAGPDLVVPASLVKLLTSAAALRALGPEHRFRTDVVRRGRTLVLVGGGDPLLARSPPPTALYPDRADVATLAGLVARRLSTAGVARVRLGYDDFLFAGPAVSPAWEPGYVPDVVSPITSLWVDEGRDRAGFARRTTEPAAAAAAAFATSLRAAGVRVAPELTRMPAPEGAVEVASVRSAPLAEIVQHTLEASDNEAAEVLARHVALAGGEPASFAGAVRAVTAQVRAAGVDLDDAEVYDGSGLSRLDRLAPGTLLDVLHTAAREPALDTVVSGLPVAGFTGSLAYRFDETPLAARGRVRAKSGTLTGVTGLAGTVVTRDGVLLGFVVVADRVKKRNTLAARETLDEIAASLATCRCASR